MKSIDDAVGKDTRIKDSPAIAMTRTVTLGQLTKGGGGTAIFEMDI